MSTDAAGPDVDTGPATAPPDVAARAEALVAQFPECFWSWRPDARVRTTADGRLVIHHLRAHGGHRAWLAAQDLYPAD